MVVLASTPLPFVLTDRSRGTAQYQIVACAVILDTCMCCLVLCTGLPATAVY